LQTYTTLHSDSGLLPLLLQGTYGGGLAMYSATRADLRNNLIAHNTALKYGGGMECAK
jgi:hypothetical protein